MKKICLILISFIFTLSANAITSGQFSINQKQNREEISYKLPLTPEFKNTIINSLKTGQVISVSHAIKIRPVNQWFGWLAKKTYTKYYKYNLINGQHFIGIKKNKLKPVADLNSLLADLASLKNAPFLPKKVLQKGQAYEIDFTISINSLSSTPLNTSSKINEKLMLFKGESLKERLHSAVHYINQ